MADFAELNRMLEEAMQAIVPDDLKAKGWIYRDMPGRATHEAWDLLLDLMGDGEYQVIAMSTGTDGQGTPYKRGQFFISPQGIKNLGDRERLETKRAAYRQASKGE
jgi:hypothetical protein